MVEFGFDFGGLWGWGFWADGARVVARFLNRWVQAKFDGRWDAQVL